MPQADRYFRWVLTGMQGGSSPMDRRGEGGGSEASAAGSEVVLAGRGLGSGGGGEATGDAYAEDAGGELGRQISVVELAAEAEAQLVIALGVFEVRGGKVDPDQVPFAAEHDQVRAPHDDLDARGLHVG